VAAQVRPSIAAAVSDFKLNRQVAALSLANRGVSWAFLLLLCVGTGGVSSWRCCNTVKATDFEFDFRVLRKGPHMTPLNFLKEVVAMVT